MQIAGMDLSERLRGVTMLAMDVDGVLTDGTVAYDTLGGEQKRFHVADGLGMVVLQQCGIPVAWISGRASPVVERRAEELGVRYLLQGVRDKALALARLCAELEQNLSHVAYIGDDWNDIPALEPVGVRIAVANAADALIERAHYVTRRNGGNGAVREVCELILRERGESNHALQRYLESLKRERDVDRVGHQTGDLPSGFKVSSDKFSRGAQQ